MSEKKKVGVWQWIKGICSPQEEKENDEGARGEEKENDEGARGEEKENDEGARGEEKENDQPKF